MRTRREFLVLLGGAGLQPGGPEAEAPAPPVTRLVLGGDVMLSRHVGRLARRWNDPAWPFREVAGYLAVADIAFVNLESPFSDHGRLVEKGMVFKAEPAMIDGLRLAGIDVVSTANNHARDCGAHGLEYTLRWLGEHGIRAVGTGADEQAVRNGAVLECNGLRFGFLAYTYDQSNGNHKDRDPRVGMLDAEKMREDVERMRSRAAVVVVSMHAGEEYQARPSREQVEFARAAIEAGARVVAGHHPHVVQPAERYLGGVIFYSLGNLVFDQFHRKDTQVGALAEVTFRGAALERAELRRVDIVRAVPRLTTDAATAVQ